MESARFATGALTLSVLRATSDAPGATAQLPAAPFPPLRARKPAWSRAGPLGPAGTQDSSAGAGRRGRAAPHASHEHVFVPQGCWVTAGGPARLRLGAES